MNAALKDAEVASALEGRLVRSSSSTIAETSWIQKNPATTPTIKPVRAKTAFDKEEMPCAFEFFQYFPVAAH
jgi:hypothetical protein